jgi:hypothetical protein
MPVFPDQSHLFTMFKDFVLSFTVWNSKFYKKEIYQQNIINCNFREKVTAQLREEMF